MTPKMKVAVDALDVVHDPRFVAGPFEPGGPVLTRCNIYTRALLSFLGLAIPALRANDLFHWFDSFAARDLGWQECSTAVAQRSAVDEIVVGVWFNPAGHPGHIVTLTDDKGNCTQAGGHNYVEAPLTKCFTADQIKHVRWFRHSYP